ncbi:hypothetical protein FACS189485_23420 [Spirochaetia bacterium]|nr:hypothetical protein FACS189485_23420 [Spirochaetia bacterium]
MEIFPLDIKKQDLLNIINNININFSMYPTLNSWNKKENVPLLDTDRKRNYRTIITEAAKEKPNFDGKYRIVEFGYGTSAQYFFIIDLNNGKVFEGIPSTSGIKYTNDSSLIIINPMENLLQIWDDIIPSWEIIRYLKWEGETFKELLIIEH